MADEQAQAPKKWKRTVIELVVLSEIGEEIDGRDLGEIAYEIDEGGCVGTTVVKSTTPLDEEGVKAALLEAGSDESFFEYD